MSQLIFLVYISLPYEWSRFAHHIQLEPGSIPGWCGMTHGSTENVGPWREEKMLIMELSLFSFVFLFLGKLDTEIEIQLHLKKIA